MSSWIETIWRVTRIEGRFQTDMDDEGVTVRCSPFFDFEFKLTVSLEFSRRLTRLASGARRGRHHERFKQLLEVQVLLVAYRQSICAFFLK